MTNNQKIALFDFCETIANFQTADAFVKFVVTDLNYRSDRMYWLQKTLEKSKVSSLLFKLGFNCNKFLLLRQIKGLSKDIIIKEGQKYYDQIVSPNLIPEVITEIRRLQDEGYSLYIVSGGYDVYLHFFVEEYKFDGIICSSLRFTDGIFTGKLSKADCMGREKVRQLQDFFNCDDLKEIESVSYSDSISDLPLLSFSRNAVVVARRDNSWRKKNHFNILLWKK